jgi:hypothetical protein
MAFAKKALGGLAHLPKSESRYADFADASPPFMRRLPYHEAQPAHRKNQTRESCDESAPRNEAAISPDAEAA